MKRILLLGLVLAVSLLGLSSCNTDGNGGGSLAGSWTLDTTEDIPGDTVLGDGSFTISYLGRIDMIIFVVDLYTGSGTINSVAYTVDVVYTPVLEQASISLYVSPEDPEVDSIDLADISYTGGSTMDGDYLGQGKYASAGNDVGSGTFIATQN